MVESSCLMQVVTREVKRSLVGRKTREDFAASARRTILLLRSFRRRAELSADYKYCRGARLAQRCQQMPDFRRFRFRQDQDFVLKPQAGVMAARFRDGCWLFAYEPCIRSRTRKRRIGVSGLFFFLVRIKSEDEARCRDSHEPGSGAPPHETS